MNFRNKALLLSALLLVSAVGCTSAPNQILVETTPAAPVQTVTEEITTEAETEPELPETSVSFLAVGDDLIHTRVYMTAAEHAEAGEDYNFYYCYQNVADKIAAADVAFINQETLIAEGLEISGSNLNFNSPPELGDTLVDIGFDLVNLSNNHVLDKSVTGLSQTLDFWDRKQSENEGLTVMGVYRDTYDMQDYRIMEVNGMTIGCLGYTDHTNGYSLPADSELVIPYLSNTALIKSQIEALSEMVDCVVVSAHWGTEDTHTVRLSDKELAQEMIDWGADVIIGTGPHTLQTMEYLTRPDGTRGFVFYSLGNFLSGQTDNFNMVGGMAEFRLVRDASGSVTVEDVTCTPVITQYDDGSLHNVRVIPYYLYTDKLAASHGIPYSPYGTAKSWGWDVINSIVYSNVPEEFLKLTE